MIDRAGVVGLDLSLSRPAAVYLPKAWKGYGWKAVRWMAFDATHLRAMPVRRLFAIAEVLCDFVDRHHAQYVAIEDHAYHAGRGGTMAGAELHGSVKLRLYERLGIEATVVNIMTARKTFLGRRMPRKGARELAHEEIRSLKPPWTLANGQVPSDEGDAFLVASHLRSTLGLPAIVVG